MEKRLKRLTRVVAFTVFLWPLAGPEKTADIGQGDPWRLPGVARCQADDVVAGAFLRSYDSAFRCVLSSDGGCDVLQNQ